MASHDGIRLRWLKGRRYYEAMLHQDLWGEWVVTRAWGCEDNARGRVVNTLVASYELGLQALTETHARRVQRGYRAV